MKSTAHNLCQFPSVLAPLPNSPYSLFSTISVSQESSVSRIKGRIELFSSNSIFIVPSFSPSQCIRAKHQETEVVSAVPQKRNDLQLSTLLHDTCLEREIGLYL